jgi:hypothetical protein
MIRISSACSLLIAAALVVSAGETSRSLVKKLAQDMGVATMKGEYAKVIDQTYAPLVAQLGGRDKAVAGVETLMKQMKEKGFILKNFNVGDAGEILSEGGNSFVVLPTRVEMSVPNGKIIAKSFLLGISADQGKTWKFADGSGIIQQKEQREKLLPKLPADLKIPEPEQPQVIREK